MDILGENKLNPLDHDRKHLVVDFQTFDPKYDCLSAEEQYEVAEEAVRIMIEEGFIGHYEANRRIESKKRLLLSLQRDLADIAAQQTGGTRHPDH